MYVGNNHLKNWNNINNVNFNDKVVDPVEICIVTQVKA